MLLAIVIALPASYLIRAALRFLWGGGEWPDERWMSVEERTAWIEKHCPPLDEESEPAASSARPERSEDVRGSNA